MRVRPLLIAMLFLMPPGSAVADGDEGQWSSERGTFIVSFEVDEPIEINKIHSWVLSIQTTSGDPVTTAEISVDGGMPLHDHGMPTRPRVTENLGDGRYRLEGLRFHMNGQWEVSVTVKADGEVDTVIIALDL